VNDGKGVLFVSRTGEIFPSGFLPLSCGRFPFDSVVSVYRNATPFRILRDPDRLGGKCGVCEYRHVCGGSRARAYAVTGDPLAAEPDCTYIPKGWGEDPEPAHAKHARPQSRMSTLPTSCSGGGAAAPVN
jgi:MoaA/NifB/PqqE/SkfB family radical SAM enzyme